MGSAAAKRLRAISELLEEAYLRSSDISDKPRNLLLAYKTTYAGDPWIPALDASVALSERRYEDAVKILSEVIAGRNEGTADTPSRASLTAMYAVSLTKWSRDLRAEASTREKASQCLSEARRALEKELQMPRGPGYASEAVLRWHLGLVEFYASSDENAIQELSKLQPGNAEPLLVARAKNAVGYLMLLEGRLDEADRWFSASSSLSPELANPRINRGYLLLVRGKTAEAEQHLRSLLEGPDQLPAERDRILARLALALALDAEKNPTAATVEYEAVLRSVRGVGATEVENDLRPALVRLILAKEVFLRNRDYYALEIWGAVMLGSSCRLLCAREDRGTPLFADIRTEINQNALWVFEVAPPRPELLQYRGGVLSDILPRIDQPCTCKQQSLAQVSENRPQ